MLIPRIITAIVGLVLAVEIITCGGWVFAGAVLCLGIMAWLELKKMAANHGFHLYTVTGGGTVAVLLGGCGYFLMNSVEAGVLFMAINFALALSFLLVAFEGLIRHCNKGETNWTGDVALNIFGVFYCGFLLSYVMFLRSVPGEPVMFVHLMEYGEALLWTVLVGVWVSDTFAYFVGITLGRHKFCSVSPKKSWEGAIGGFLGSMALVVYSGQYLLMLSPLQAHLIGFGIAFFAPIGDLVESVLKRGFGVKDSGKLLPGHGGVLDRFDSLLFAAPIAYCVLLVTGLIR